MERTAQEKEQAKMLIRFYNLQANCSIGPTAQMNQETVFTCLERIGGDPVLVKNHIRKWVSEHMAEGNFSTRFEECLEAIEIPKGVVRTSEESVGASLNILENAVASIIVKTQSEKIAEQIMGNVQNEVRDFIDKNYGPIERKVTIVINDTKKEMKKGTIVHEKFGDVLDLVANDKPVYLYGPAGSGKNVICKQVAEALGLHFYFSNAVTQEYKLTGFTDAFGNYQETQFYKAFTEGGVFMLDELDASIPEVLTILNAAIANRYFDFPAPIGFKEAHKDFRVIAAGNTSGNGADYVYVGRNQLDGSTLDRFQKVPIDYCVEVENKIANDLELANFCREFRAASKKVGVNIIVSYRAIEGLSVTTRLFDLKKALSYSLVKDLEKDDLNIIINELKDSKYRTALKELSSEM